MKVQLKKVLLFMMASVCSMSSLTPHIAYANDTTNGDELIDADIYPKPVLMESLSQEGMTFNGQVNVVIHGEQEDATRSHLESILKENNIDYEITENIVSDKANLLLSSDVNHCEICKDIEKMNTEALEKAGGYLLSATNDENAYGEVKIVGTDEDGVFNGLMTLKQMIEQGSDGKFAEVKIEDYPNIKSRGVIEGFYGFPWSFEDRASMIRDMSEYKMNIYMYAPKDDPYHRDQWREPYPSGF